MCSLSGLCIEQFVFDTWHNDSPFRIQSLWVDLDGRHRVVTCVPIQQVALKVRRMSENKLLHRFYNGLLDILIPKRHENVITETSLLRLILKSASKHKTH